MRKKEKIAKIMRKEPSIFVSAQLRSCLLASPFGYHSDVCICYKPMTGAVQVAPSATFSKLLAIHSLWLNPPGLAAPGLGQVAQQSWILSTWDPGVCQPMSQVTTGPPLPVSACWPAVSLRLVTDLTMSERGSGGTQGP